MVMEQIVLVAEIVVIVYAACVAIAKLTPTQKDNKALEKVRKIFQFIEDVIPNLKVTKKGIKRK